MSADSVLLAFLHRQKTEGDALAAQTDVVRVLALPGDPPSRYLAHFRDCRGLIKNERGQIAEFDRFSVGICFTEHHLQQIEIPQLLTYLGPFPAFHPNFGGPFICANLPPGAGLVDILYTLYELWTWKLYGTRDDGLNHEASQWSRKQEKNRFPIDERAFKRRIAPASAVSPDALQPTP